MAMRLPKFLCVLIPVPTAVPPWANSDSNGWTDLIRLILGPH